jgi:glycosyltransferase involved in cell wall biosynthesis
MGAWFDVQAVSRAALLHPEWSFVLIGRNDGADLGSISTLPNVHLLGEKPYTELPVYLCAFAACVIPFLSTPLTQAASPVKFFEYLSSGKPVVAASLPELQDYQQVAELYSRPDEFVRCLERALAADSPTLVRLRQQVARANTWRRRYEQLRAGVSSIPSPG